MLHQPHTRRRLAATLVAGLVAVTLAGCGAATTSEAPAATSAPAQTGAPAPTAAPVEPVTLTMTIWGNETDKAVYTERLALAKAAYPEITVNLQQISEEYDTKLQTMVAGGEAPDLMMMAEAINVYSSAGQLADLNPFYQAAGIDPVATFGAGAVATYSTGGSLWASPDRSGAAVLFYNKDMFDAAGVAYPDASWTWDDFRSAAKQLTIRDGDEVTQWGYGAGDWWPWWLNWMKQSGGDILDADGKPIIDSPENASALQFYNDMVFQDRSALSPRDYANAGLNNGQPDPLFAQGRLAMGVTGFWNVGSLKDSTINWDISPVWRGTQQATAAFGSGIAVSSTSQNPEAAAKIALFLSSEAGQAPIIESGLDVPANIAAASSDAFTSPTWLTRDVNLGAFGESAAFTYSPPLVPEWNEIQKAFTDGLAGVWNENEPAADGLARVQASVEKILGD